MAKIKLVPSEDGTKQTMVAIDKFCCYGETILPGTEGATLIGKCQIQSDKGIWISSGIVVIDSDISDSFFCLGTGTIKNSTICGGVAITAKNGINIESSTLNGEINIDGISIDIVESAILGNSRICSSSISYSNIEECPNVINSKIKGAICSSSKLRYSTVVNSNVNDASLERTIVEKSRLSRAKATDCNIIGVNEPKDIILTNVVFEKCKIKGKNIVVTNSDISGKVEIGNKTHVRNSSIRTTRQMRIYSLPKCSLLFINGAVIRKPEDLFIFEVTSKKIIALYTRNTESKPEIPMTYSAYGDYEIRKPSSFKTTMKEWFLKDFEISEYDMQKRKDLIWLKWFLFSEENVIEKDIERQISVIEDIINISFERTEKDKISEIIYFSMIQAAGKIVSHISTREDAKKYYYSLNKKNNAKQVSEKIERAFCTIDIANKRNVYYESFIGTQQLIKYIKTEKTINRGNLLSKSKLPC